MVTTMFLAMAASAFATDCTPWFYRHLPRDGQYVYAVGTDVDADRARAFAVAKLGDVDEWEQDDARACHGIQFVMVRATRAAAAGAVAKRDRAQTAIIGRLDPRVTAVEYQAAGLGVLAEEHGVHLKGEDLALARLQARVEAIKAGHVVSGEDPLAPAPSLPPKVELAIKMKLRPHFEESMSRLERGTWAVKDFAYLMGTYETLGQTGEQRRLCACVLKQHERMNTHELEWATKRCQKL